MSIDWDKGCDRMAKVYLEKKPRSALSDVPSLHRKFFRKKLMAGLGKTFIREMANGVIGGTSATKAEDWEGLATQILIKIFEQYDYGNPKERHEYNSTYIACFYEDLLNALDKLGFSEDQKNCVLEAIKVKENQKITDVVVSSRALEDADKGKWSLESMKPEIAQYYLDYLQGDSLGKLKFRNKTQEGFVTLMFDILDSNEKGTEGYDQWEKLFSGIVDPQNILRDL